VLSFLVGQLSPNPPLLFVHFKNLSSKVSHALFGLIHLPKEFKLSFIPNDFVGDQIFDYFPSALYNLRMTQNKLNGAQTNDIAETINIIAQPQPLAELCRNRFISTGRRLELVGGGSGGWSVLAVIFAILQHPRHRWQCHPIAVKQPFRSCSDANDERRRCVLFNQNVVKKIMEILGPVRLGCPHEVIDNLPLLGVC